MNEYEKESNELIRKIEYRTIDKKKITEKVKNLKNALKLPKDTIEIVIRGSRVFHNVDNYKKIIGLELKEAEEILSLFDKKPELVTKRIIKSDIGTRSINEVK